MPGEDEVVGQVEQGEEVEVFSANSESEPEKDIIFEVDEEKDEATQVDEEAPAAADDDVTDELVGTGERVRKRINQLTYEKKESGRVADEALNYAKTVHQENEILKKRLAGQEDHTLTEAEERNKSQMAEAKTAYKNAYEDEDADGMADANELIGQLSADKNAIMRAKRNAAAKKEEDVLEEDAPAAPAAAAAAPAEELDQKAVAWAEKTEWFGAHEGMTDYAMQQHFNMVNKEGFDPKSDEYYIEVEKRVQGMFPHMFKKRAPASSAEPGAPEEVGRPKPRQTVAPAGNASGSATKRTKTVVTTSEQTVAESLGIPNEAYAREKARLARERAANA